MPHLRRLVPPFAVLFLGAALAQEGDAPNGTGTPGDGDGVPVQQEITALDGELSVDSSGSDKLAEADILRRNWLSFARARVVQLRNAIASGGAMDAEVLHKVQAWLWIGNTVPRVQDLDAVIAVMDRNAAQNSTVAAWPAKPLLRCPGDPDDDGSGGSALACGVINGSTIYLRKVWTDAGQDCRVSVLTHEYFHNVGAGHGGDASGKAKCTAAQPMSQILDNADCLAGLVCALGGGQTCGTPC